MLSPITYLLVYCILVLQTCAVTNTDGNQDPDYNIIKNIHQQMDDDHDGEINLNESAQYMKTQLEEPNDKRQSQFHNNDDHISIDELWKKWLESPVYSWTIDDVVNWLKNTAKLPKYEKTFRANKVIGKNMPRLATSKEAYVKQELKISNKNDRRKIYLHASALIMFGEEKHVDKNFLAIEAIHKHLDDNLDDTFNINETLDFVKGELKGQSTNRHTSIHTHDDHISVDDLWRSWEYSEVYNWTNEEVITWLKDHVGFPQYENIFREKKVDGKCIPRLATDLPKELGIVNSKHRKKIYLQTLDIIIFGAHKRGTNLFSDTIVLLTVLVASLLIFYAFHQKSLSKKEIEKLTADFDFLKQAEQQLRELQELEGSTASKETEILLREEIEAAKKETERLSKEHSKHEEEKSKLQILEQEIYELRLQLAQAKKDVKNNAPLGLQNLLVLTYRKEVQNFHMKKQQALSQMQEAKEACEKVNKTRRAVFGSLRLAHGQSIDVVDQKILNAKTALAEVTKDLQERQSRWQQVECICNFSIVNEEKKSLKVLLNDNLLYGSKGQIGSLEGYDSPLLGLSESEQLDQLDNEVEAITRKGKLIRSGTESSSSSESSQSKNGLSESSPITKPVHNPASPRLFKGTVDIKSTTSYDNLSLHSQGSTSSLEVENFHTSSTFPNLEDAANDTLVKRKNLHLYTRSNTDPSVVSSLTEENGASPKSTKSRSGARPLSMTEKDLKKKKKVLSLSRFTNNTNNT